jgi:hypothetical protein
MTVLRVVGMWLCLIAVPPVLIWVIVMRRRM